jgi:hypothetical protein
MRRSCTVPDARALSNRLATGHVEVAPRFIERICKTLQKRPSALVSFYLPMRPLVAAEQDLLQITGHDVAWDITAQPLHQSRSLHDLYTTAQLRKPARGMFSPSRLAASEQAMIPSAVVHDTQPVLPAVVVTRPSSTSAGAAAASVQVHRGEPHEVRRDYRKPDASRHPHDRFGTRPWTPKRPRVKPSCHSAP